VTTPQPDLATLHAHSVRLHDAIATAKATTADDTTASHLEAAQLAMAPVLTHLRHAQES
jgi:hypothetical protein